MPDVYARITELDEAVVDQLADAMELRATDPVQRAFVDAYLSELDPPDRARFLEIGCGTGAISRLLAARPGVGSVVGVDPSQILLDRARELSSSLPNLTFELGDGRARDAAFAERSTYDDAMATYQAARDEHAMPMYEMTFDFAQLDQPPPPETQQLLGAVAGNRRAMDDFVSVQAGALPIPEFFSPDNIGHIMAAQTPRA